MNGTSPILLATDNPVAKLNQRSNYGWKNRYYGNIQLDYKFHFLPELKATVIAGLDRTARNYDNKLSNQSINGYLVGGNPLANGGSYAFGWGRNTQKVFDAYLNYAKVFGNLSVDVTAGHSYQERATTSFNSGDMSVPTNTINSLNTYKNPISKLESYFGRVNLGYKEKYLLTLNVRNDMTNNFSKANRSAFFPGMAAAWVASKEDFLAGNKTLTNLKVRFGWGLQVNKICLQTSLIFLNIQRQVMVLSIHLETLLFLLLVLSSTLKQSNGNKLQLQMWVWIMNYLEKLEVLLMCTKTH